MGDCKTAVLVLANDNYGCCVVDLYNYRRPHGALEGQTPYERLVQKTRAGLSARSQDSTRRIKVKRQSGQSLEKLLQWQIAEIKQGRASEIRLASRQLENVPDSVREISDSDIEILDLGRNMIEGFPNGSAR